MNLLDNWLQSLQDKSVHCDFCVYTGHHKKINMHIKQDRMKRYMFLDTIPCSPLKVI
jgi:hypothetical protein